MYKAINAQDGKDIVILDPGWADHLEDLRSLDKQGVLACQGCGQAVRVRAGEVRRWHFAHKHLQNCTFGTESPELLNARAVLYEWLKSKFGQKVIIEKKLDERYFARPVDCWVENESVNIAYWILEKPLQPEARERIRQGFEKVGAIVNWVLVSQMLREDKDDSEKVLLTTTEREFMRETRYDAPLGEGLALGGTLHYIDTTQRALTTFRGLSLVHSPQVYKGRKLSRPLCEILVSPKNGEFVQPGVLLKTQNPPP